MTNTFTLNSSLEITVITSFSWEHYWFMRSEPTAFTRPPVHLTTWPSDHQPLRRKTHVSEINCTTPWSRKLKLSREICWRSHNFFFQETAAAGAELSCLDSLKIFKLSSGNKFERFLFTLAKIERLKFWFGGGAQNKSGELQSMATTRHLRHSLLSVEMFITSLIPLKFLSTDKCLICQNAF